MKSTFKIKEYAFLAFLSLGVFSLDAQIVKTPSATSISSAPVSPSPLPLNDKDLLAERIKKLEDKEGDKLTAPLMVAVIAGCLALLGQYLNASRQRKLDSNKALFEQTERILEFRIKQLELFYAPMFALLGQSEAIYFTLLRQLQKDVPNRYILLKEKDADGNWMQVKVRHNPAYGFRLLDELPTVKRHPKAMILVDKILGVGEKMTAIISEHAGLAKADLVALLGEYAAHFAILSIIREGSANTVPPPEKKTLGYYPYPRGLNKKVEEGYRELSQLLDTYSETSKKMLATVLTEFDKQNT